MKKVGILTLYYKTYNYGAQLQAYALQQAIESLGFPCEQIQFAWSCVQTEWNYQNSSIDYDRFEEFYGQIPHSKTVYTPETIRACADEYDMFVCGSDQIWGVQNSMPAYVLPQITLSFVPEDKVKIGYGISMGGARVSSRTADALQCAAQRLDAVSVREKSAVPFVEALTGKAVSTVLDPVFLLDREAWRKIVVKVRETPYILHYNISRNPLLSQAAEQLARERSCEVVNLGYIEAEKFGPREFLGLVSNADYVLTDSFHGTALSILFGKQFSTVGIDKIPSEYSKNYRILDLLRLFGLENRFFKHGSSTDALLQTPRIDYDDVQQRLQALREDSLRFLEGALRSGVRETETAQNSVIPAAHCNGCGACVLACPKKCISFRADDLGFLYPQIHRDACTSCGQCLEVCPVRSGGGAKSDKVSAYAARSADDRIREISSSGGVFYELARSVLEDGGIVAAARYDNDFQVCHGICERLEDLEPFCMSKYVPSNAFTVFPAVRDALRSGKTVLFVGTPCQTEGLQAYLGETFEKLYIVDLICGGVASPELWKRYLNFWREREGDIRKIFMRSKTLGYLNSSGSTFNAMEIDFGKHQEVIVGGEDLFSDYRYSFYRESCYQCKFKSVNRVSDLSLGDLRWPEARSPQEVDGCGTTVTLVQSEKGYQLLKNCKERLLWNEISVGNVVAKSTMVLQNQRKPPQADYLRGLMKTSSIEKLYYEDQGVLKFLQKEQLHRALLCEMQRSELLLKLQRYQAFGLNLENDPLIKGRIILYGAGKVGRALTRCMADTPALFLDQFAQIKKCCGCDVIQPDAWQLRARLGTGKGYSVIVTPVWDFLTIKENLKAACPEIQVISVEKVVEKLWNGL